VNHLITPLLARETELGRSVRAAQQGSDPAWERLVRELTPTLRRIASSRGVRGADLDDVVQTTWLDAYRGLGGLRQPNAIMGWLATTTRRNASTTRQSAARELPSEAPEPNGHHEDETLEAVEREQRAHALRAAVRRLPAHQCELLEALLDHPLASYQELAAALEVPIGSIGPTRGRSLERLRDDAAFAQAIAA
jgi:RNA polymerase sigma factor (sigma-70 family)